MLNLGSDRTPAAVPLDRTNLLARLRIRQFARAGRRAPHKPLLLLHALARRKHDRQTKIRFNATEAIVNPLLRSYGPWGPGNKVFPPTYPGEGQNAPPRHVFESRRIDGQDVRCVLIDSVQSQANR